jgi:hypothetical protein
MFAWLTRTPILYSKGRTLQCLYTPWNSPDLLVEQLSDVRQLPATNSTINGAERLEKLIGVTNLSQTLAVLDPILYMNRLSTWQNVNRGKDIFVPGGGSFDVVQAFNTSIKYHRRLWAKTFLDCIKGSYLRTSGKILTGSRQSKLLPSKIDNLRLALAAENWNRNQFVDFMQIAAQDKTALKSRMFSDELPFIDSHWVDYNNLYPARFVKKLNIAKFIECVEIGTFNDCQTEEETIWWLPTLQEVQAWGYFPQELESNPSVLADLCTLFFAKDSPQTKHVIKYRDYWKASTNILQIHEMTHTLHYRSAAYWPRNADTLHPKHLLPTIRRSINYFEHQKKYAGVTFDLVDLPDEGNLRVLRTPFDVTEVAEKLNNCAAMYIDRIAKKAQVLVALYNVHNVPIALGRVLIKGVSSPYWTEIKGNCNTPVGTDILNDFDNYKPIFLRWFHKRRGFHDPNKNTKNTQYTCRYRYPERF